MMGPISVLNKTMELADCRDQWFYDEKHGCWCLEDILYTPAATTPKFQRLSIFVPKALLNADGSFPEEAKKCPWYLKTTPQAICRCPMYGWAAPAAMPSNI